MLSGAFVTFPVRRAILFDTLTSVGSVRLFLRVGHGVGQARMARTNVLNSCSSLAKV